MSLLRKFQNLNNFTYNKDYYKLIYGTDHIGFVHREIVKYLIVSVNNFFSGQNFLENKSIIELKQFKITEILSKKIFLYLQMSYSLVDNLLIV